MGKNRRYIATKLQGKIFITSLIMDAYEFLSHILREKVLFYAIQYLILKKHHHLYFIDLITPEKGRHPVDESSPTMTEFIYPLQKLENPFIQVFIKQWRLFPLKLR